MFSKKFKNPNETLEHLCDLEKKISRLEERCDYLFSIVYADRAAIRTLDKKADSIKRWIQHNVKLCRELEKKGIKNGL